MNAKFDGVIIGATPVITGNFHVSIRSLNTDYYSSELHTSVSNESLQNFLLHPDITLDEIQKAQQRYFKHMSTIFSTVLKKELLKL